jgi:uncharacterized protein (DUF1330 family)
MSAYIIAIGNVKNPEAYEGYRALAGPAVAKYGGRFLARGGKHEILEGSVLGGRVVIVEFESLAKAKEFYDSPEYQAAREKRRDAADLNLVLVEGV